MQQKVKEIVGELRRRFEALYGDRLVKMVLYGSQARDDAEPGSDIDVLVVLRGQVSPCEEIGRTVEDVAEISLNNDAVLACVFISKVEFEQRNTPLLLNVRREGVTV